MFSCSENDDDEVGNTSHASDTRGHDYVDLGLPSGLKWATMNLGAKSPEDYGDYFAWGETKKKDYYDWQSYKWCTSDGTENHTRMTKYCSHSEYGTVDNKIVLEPNDDAAHVVWGGDWRMPTREEMVELREKCTWEWTSLNRVNGYKVTGPNGKSIFLPAASAMYKDIAAPLAGTNGDYWTSSVNPDFNSLTHGDFIAFCLYTTPREYYVGCAGRGNGDSVRAVCK